MDPSRFDAFTRVVAADHSRRRALKVVAGGAIAAVMAAVGLDRVEAARLRSVGNACRVDSDCASHFCVQEARGRKICHCRTTADCPTPPGPACTTATCAASGLCSTTRDTTGISCDQAQPDCCGGQVCGGEAAGPTTCRTNQAPVACDASIRHPWRSDCIPVTMRGGDSDQDLGWIQIASVPEHGFLTDFVPASASDAPALAGVRALLGGICDAWAQPSPNYPVVRCAAPVTFPPGWLQSHDVGEYVCSEANYFQRTMCYVPFSSSWTGFDSFTFVAIDEWGATSAPALISIEVFEV